MREASVTRLTKAGDRGNFLLRGEGREAKVFVRSPSFPRCELWFRMPCATGVMLGVVSVSFVKL